MSKIRRKRRDAGKDAGKRGGKRRAAAAAVDAAAVDARAALAALEHEGVPMNLGQLVRRLNLKSDEATRAELQDVLARLVRNGEVLRNRRDEYLLVGHTDLVVGRVHGHRDGFGFLIRDDADGSAKSGANRSEEQRDVFLPAKQMRRLMDGDRAAVQIRRHDHQGRPVGTVVEVLERAHTQIAGRLQREGDVTFLIPDNPRLPHHVVIPRAGVGKARHGQVVVVQLEHYPEEERLAIGRVVHVIGDIDAAGVEVETAIHAFGLRHEWPADVAAEADSFPARVSAKDKRGREDLRDLPLVTIDGEDARDFDDAVYCAPDGDGWRLIVAIADVSHYVRVGQPLDHEAALRGTSVYFPNRVLPMLPEALSNGLCSLNPKVDRLCMVCDMRVSRQGKVTQSRFFAGLMRSAARLTYTEVEELLTHGRASRETRKLHERLDALHQVYLALARARRRRGALDFDLPAVYFHFDDEGQISGLSTQHRGVSHRLIEECMIAANVEAAGFLRRHRMPTLYRVHEAPSDEKLDELRLFLDTFGIRLSPGQTLKPKTLNDALQRLQGHPQLEMVETVVLQSMKQAVYQPRNIGHFGLALPAYAHFTSPIRRYPDLLVHRGIRHVLEHGSARGSAYSMEAMQQLGEQTSQAERRADEATWDAQNRLKCVFMKDRLGQEYAAVVTGVVPFGLFVKLTELHVEGLVHVSSLGGDYYRHDPVTRSLKGERTGRRFQLSDTLRVRVVRVSVESRQIDFELAGAPRAAARGKVA